MSRTHPGYDLTMEQMAESIEKNLTQYGCVSVGPDEWKRVIAAMRIVAKIAALEPIEAGDRCSDSICFFCSAFYPGEIDDHAKDCLWEAARKLSEAK